MVKLLTSAPAGVKLKNKTKNKTIDLEKIKERIEKNFGKVGIR